MPQNTKPLPSVDVVQIPHYAQTDMVALFLSMKMIKSLIKLCEYNCDIHVHIFLNNIVIH